HPRAVPPADSPCRGGGQPAGPDRGRPVRVHPQFGAGVAGGEGDRHTASGWGGPPPAAGGPRAVGAGPPGPPRPGPHGGPGAGALSQLTTEFLCDLADPGACQAWLRAVLADPNAKDATRLNALKIDSRLKTPARKDLRGARLAGEDLTQRDLTEVDLTGADL